MFGQTGQSGAKPPGGFTFGASNTASGSTVGGGFTFGASSAAPGTTATTATTGFTLGNSTATAPTTKPFTFGSAAASTPGSSFNFGGLSSGSTATTTATPTPSISFGTPAQKPGGPFGSTPSTSTSTATTGGFNFGRTAGATGLIATKPTAPVTQGLFLGNTTSVATTSSTGTASGSTPAIFTSQPASTGSRLLGLGTSTSSSGQVLKLGSTPSITATGFGATGTTAGLGLGIAKTATTTAGKASSTTGGIMSTGATSGTLSSFGSLAKSAATTSASSTAQPTVSTVTATSSSTPQLSYKQLEEHINKWVSDLEDYERTFLDQAAQVNAWDRLLMENGEKITALNGNVEGVKAEQKRLDEELDFILAQQQELEVLLKPLEEELKKRTTGPGQLQHADREREFTYGLAKDIDCQLKQMVGDLKSIIDHLNAAGSIQQESNDPIIQVAKILNAHMNSLQWIDQNAALLQRKVDEVSSLSEIRRKEQERNFRLAFD